MAYDAFEPGAQLWVAATLYQSAITVYEKVFGVLGPDDAEDVYRRYAVLGTALQVPEQSWPATRADFERYWAASVADLVVTDEARRVASDLLHPRTAPAWLRALMPIVRLATAGLLTPELRRAFVLPWSARHQRSFDRLFAATRLLYPHLPARVRHLPRDRYLRALRRSLASHPAS
ncbi:oxygenase MpaB family protein [Subtercola sp. YIM 133946]